MGNTSTGDGRPEVPVVRIFLSSPGDVADERTAARTLIDTVLPKHPSLRERVRLEPIAWDDPESHIPLLATETPQQSVTAARPRPATCDIVIVILWSRMGTPLPDDIRKPDGSPYRSGTEWEFEDAIGSPREPKPEVLVYRRTDKPKLEIDDPDFDAKREQYREVQAFVADLIERKCGVNDYATPEAFSHVLEQHLHDLLHRRLSPPAADAAVPPAAEIPPAYLAWMRDACAGVDLLGRNIQDGLAITLNQVYVPALTQDVLITGDATVLKTDTLLKRLDTESLYVPAEAGAGKSTFCRWAALRCAGGVAMDHPVPAPAGFAEPVPVGLQGRLPLLVVLREFWTSMDCRRGCRTWSRAQLEAALAAWVDETRPGGLTGGVVRACLEAGQVFLMLDGLDEVPPSEPAGDGAIYPRALLLTGLADALPAWEEAGNRTLVTSRPYGLDAAGVAALGLPQAPMAPLPEPLQDLFVGRWFHTLKKDRLAGELIDAIRGREDVAVLADNPMLLTALCVIYGNGGRLPDDRYDLYRSMVGNVLYNRYPGDAREREPVKARLEVVALGMHTGRKPGERAGRLRRTPAAEVRVAEIDRLLAAFAEVNPAFEEGAVKPMGWREELLDRSGLLRERPGGKAAFYHLSFQEFLAAERLARTTDGSRALETLFGRYSAVPEWRSTLMFLFAGQVFNYRDRQWGFDLLDTLSNSKRLERAAVRAKPAPAVFLAEALGLCLAKGWTVPPALAERFRRVCLAAIEDEVELRDRAALGLCLGRLGDPRIRDLRDPEATVAVPAGVYPFGEAGDTVTIGAPFRLGRFPVTNGQYRAFIDDGGYDRPDVWSPEGRAWREEERVTEPRFWHDHRFNAPNQPVVGVSFWEAEAFCAWAGGRLPTEAEREAAARGTEGFDYPWGNDWEDGICNSAEAGLRIASPVGLFPRSRQLRLGLEDLAGNVWEWCADPYDRDDQGARALRVIRGGSWILGARDARSASRSAIHPGRAIGTLGFRFCLRSQGVERRVRPKPG